MPGTWPKRQRRGDVDKDWEKAIDVMILDFKRAFMSVPVAGSERRFNCCLSEVPIKRKRRALDPDEPRQGCFIVWHVLGFGGRTYPLLWARVLLVAPARVLPPTRCGSRGGAGGGGS